MDRKEFYARIAMFSPREVEVARLISHGLSNAQIALRLTRNDGEGHVSTGTVKGYIQSVLAKLGLDSRVLVAVFWERHVGAEWTPADRHSRKIVPVAYLSSATLSSPPPR